MDLQGKELLNCIEVLRDQLNKNVDTTNNIPKNCPATFALSEGLDELINRYMREHKKA